jgi:hypothetical protein
MPGSAVLVGILPCYDSRVVHDDKPRTITADGEVVLGTDNNDNILTSTAVIQYFTPLSQPLPSDGSLYFIHGKIVSIEGDMDLGRGHSKDNYEFFVEADMVRDFWCPHCYKILSFLCVC